MLYSDFTPAQWALYWISNTGIGVALVLLAFRIRGLGYTDVLVPSLVFTLSAVMMALAAHFVLLPVALYMHWRSIMMTVDLIALSVCGSVAFVLWFNFIGSERW